MKEDLRLRRELTGRSAEGECVSKKAVAFFAKKIGYRNGTAHKVYDNLLQQDFTAEKTNQKWCTDFIYLFLKNGEVCYNCTILDLFDRSVVSIITDKNITSD